MLKIRLAAEVHQQAHWSQVAVRLRRAIIDLVPIGDLAASVQGGCDAVVLSEPGPADPGTIQRLLSAGKHVLVTGVLATAWPAWEGLSAAAQRSGVQWSIVNPDRYLPSRQLIKHEVQTRLGEVGLIRSHRWQSTRTSTLCHGLPRALVHDIDLAMWLADKPVEHVFAVEQPSAGFWQVHLGWPDGMALIDYADRLSPGAEYQNLSVIGASGAAYADDHQNMQLAFQDGIAHAVRTDEGLVGDVAILQAFVDGVLGGSDLTAATSDWRPVLAVAIAAAQSVEGGQAVNVVGTLRVP